VCVCVLITSPRVDIMCAQSKADDDDHHGDGVIMYILYAMAVCD